MFTEGMDPAENATPGYLVWRLATRWRTAVDRRLAPLGLTHARYAFMASLKQLSADGTRPSQRELCDYSGLEPVYVSKLARALEREGLLERTEQPRDSRAVGLALTPDGHARLGPAIDRVAALLDELTAPLGGRGGGKTRQFMDTLHELLRTDIRERTSN